MKRDICEDLVRTLRFRSPNSAFEEKVEVGETLKLPGVNQPIVSKLEAATWTTPLVGHTFLILQAQLTCAFTLLHHCCINFACATQGYELDAASASYLLLLLMTPLTLLRAPRFHPSMALWLQQQTVPLACLDFDARDGPGCHQQTSLLPLSPYPDFLPRSRSSSQVRSTHITYLLSLGSQSNFCEGLRRGGQIFCRGIKLRCSPGGYIHPILYELALVGVHLGRN